MLIRLAELFKGSETCFESDIHGEFQKYLLNSVMLFCIVADSLFWANTDSKP
jgi:hypothetical protein